MDKDEERRKRRDAYYRRKANQTEQDKQVAREYKKNGKGYYFTWANAAKHRAIEKNIPFNIDADYLMEIMSTHCPVLGVEFVKGDGCSNPHSPTIDRIVPERGYVRGNIIIISKRANQIKSDASPDEILKVGNYFKSLFESSI